MPTSNLSALTLVSKRVQGGDEVLEFGSMLMMGIKHAVLCYLLCLGMG